MNEDLEIKAPRILPMGFKINLDERALIVKTVEERNWKMSAFLRVCVLKEIERLNNEG